MQSIWPARGHVKLSSRLRLVVAGAIAVLMLLLFVLFAGLEMRDAQERHHERASAITAVLAETVRGSLAFFDTEAAAKILASAGALPGIRWAALLDADQRLFASFAVPDQQLLKPAELVARLQCAPPGNAVNLFEQDGALYVTQVVKVDGQPIGWLMLDLDAENPSLQFLGRLGIVMLAAAVFGLIASFAAARALERIAWPIMNLASMMREVSITHDYRMRLMHHRSDEIGELHDGFNGLLEQLEAREQEIAAQQNDLVRLANLDEVTQLSNRHHFRQLLDRALKRAGDVPFALLCLDLERFKNVNDSLGHDLGDQVLRLVGERLRSIARAEDTMARTGGDEFSVIMSRVSRDDEALPFARRILCSLREPFEINGLTLHIGASIGIALAPRDALAPEQLIKYADLALYEVKAAGRNTVRVYQPAMGNVVDRRLILEQELREALARGQLTLVYQPQIQTRDRTVTGLEALLRWNHPVLGVVAPAEFIPIAEDSGLVAEIGAWALEEACREVQLHDDKLSIAVNLSPVQVMTQDLAALIDGVLARTGLAAHRLELEITESVLLNEEAATLQQMAALQQRGVRIVLDDFGTGFASMAYLLRFHFEKIKIDRSFVHLLREQGRKRAIVRAIIEMSRQMDTRVLAEGVESESELQMLTRDGCTEVQGYYFSGPLNEQDLAVFLRTWNGATLSAANSAFGSVRTVPDLLLPASHA
ncbi:MAG: EAL domain-containing protein [Burkholderiaceae bacterium]